MDFVFCLCFIHDLATLDLVAMTGDGNAPLILGAIDSTCWASYISVDFTWLDLLSPHSSLTNSAQKLFQLVFKEP